MDFIIFVVNFLFSVYYILLAIRAILPWVSHSRESSLVRPVYLLTEPVLAPIRKGLPPARIGMDVSPFILIILLWIINQVILKVIS